LVHACQKPPINQAIVGVLGRGQKKYGMVVHYAVVLSNHIHLLLSPNDAQHLSEFMNFVNSNIAREVGRLVDWKEKFWGSRYHAIAVSDEKEAQLGRLLYFLRNSVKENLVEHPFEWPGVHSARALAEGGGHEGIWFDRTGYYRAKCRRKADEPMVQEDDFKTVETLELSPLPCLADLAPAEHQGQIENLIAQVVAENAAKRRAEGKMVLGAHRLQKQDPHTRPNRTKRSPAPRFHAIQEAVQKELRAAYSTFVAAFQIAAEKLRSGDLRARFPEGCFPPALPFCA